jgi:hypothetical protein
MAGSTTDAVVPLPEMLASIEHERRDVPSRLTRQRWVKSTRSSGSNGCVECRLIDARIAVRDSKLGEASPVLAFGSGAWQSLLSGVKADELDG